MQAADRITGYSLLALIALVLCNQLLSSILTTSVLGWLAGGFAWLAAVRLFKRLGRLQQGQVTLMLFIGGAGLLWGQLQGAQAFWWLSAWQANQSLLTMLLSVSFLRLVAITDLAAKETLPRGRWALWKMLLGVHFFGAVINFSAMIIMADRLNHAHPLSRLQALVIARGFTLAAHWSPFFAAMGVVLLSAPGARLFTLMLVGGLVALVGLFLAGFWLLRSEKAIDTPAYPMHWRALLLPLSLAASVMLAHSLWETVPILTLVSVLSLLFTLALLFWRYPRRGWHRLRTHVEHTLPLMSGETLLFLAAGVLAAGLGSALEAADFSVQLEHFGPWQAWGLLVLLVLVSAAGVHPVISISTAGGLFAPWVEDPTLLALTFLMTWSLGVAISPLSGTHLAMQGRYGLLAHAFTRWNTGFVLAMLLVNLLALQTYAFLV